MSLNPVYVDEHLLVLDKPAGLLSVPGRGADKQDCLSRRAQDQWSDALVVHRLDMATSGLMLMARNPEVQRQLSAAFAQRRVVKRYVAIVQGNVAPPQDEWGVIDLPLTLDWPNRPRSVVDRVNGKPSLTRWRIAPEDDRWHAFLVSGPQCTGTLSATRLELEPLTGRSHQLRVHLQTLGHPILGDTLYGEHCAAPQATRLLLHAWTLRLHHPSTGKELRFESPSPI